MLLDGVILMVTGMGVVFVFLVIMIFAMQITAKIMQVINKFFPEVVPQEAVSVAIVNTDDEIAAAIAVVKAHRNI